MRRNPHLKTELDGNMAYYSHREHPDSSTVDFMHSIGAVQIQEITDKHSVWALSFRRIAIPLDETVHEYLDLLDIIQSQSYNEGFAAGKHSAVTKINQHLSDLVFKHQ